VAVDFLRFVTGMEGNRLFSEATHSMPSVEGVPIPAELEPFRRMDDGYVVTSAQNAPTMLNGPGAENTRLWDTNVHVLYAPNGGVDAYLDAIAPRYWPAVRQDLAQQVSVARENLRRRDSMLAAQQFLSEDEQTEAGRQRAGQHLVETQTYLMDATLARTAR
jgi:raffinose/stachyose/melibiose transport system substrate-binding protein